KPAKRATEREAPKRPSSMNRTGIIMKRFLLASTVIICGAFTALAQQSEPRVALTGAASASDTKGAPAIEARLATQVLNGGEDSPVTNVKLVVKNISGTF